MKKLLKTGLLIIVSPLLIPYFAEKNDQYKTLCAKNGKKLLEWRNK